MVIPSYFLQDAPMAPRKSPDRAEASFEARLWREACEQVDLAESVQRVFALLAEHLPLDRLIVMHLYPASLRLVAAATSAPRGVYAGKRSTVRIDLDERSARELDQLLLEGQPCRLSRRQSALCQALVAQSPERVALVTPLLPPKHPAGPAVLIARAKPAASQRHLELLALAVRPLRVAYENHWRLHELGRLREALEADREIERTGEVYAAEDVHAWLERLAQGKRAPRPKPWRR